MILCLCSPVSVFAFLLISHSATNATLYSAFDSTHFTLALTLIWLVLGNKLRFRSLLRQYIRYIDTFNLYSKTDFCVSDCSDRSWPRRSIQSGVLLRILILASYSPWYTLKPLILLYNQRSYLNTCLWVLISHIQVSRLTYRSIFFQNPLAVSSEFRSKTLFLVALCKFEIFRIYLYTEPINIHLSIIHILVFDTISVNGFGLDPFLLSITYL